MPSPHGIGTCIGSTISIVIIPPGTWNVTGLTITQSNVKIVGFGWGLSVINGTTADDIIIDVGTFKQNILIKGLTITRSVTGTSGGYNIRFQANVNRCEVRDCIIEKGWRGASLTATAYSLIRNCIFQECVGDGCRLEGDGATAAHQWNFLGVLFQKNGDHGFRAVSTTGASQMIVGEMIYVMTALNSGRGLSFVGLEDCPVQDVRVRNSFLGSDGHDELFLATYGKFHMISDTFFEQAGRTATGPDLSTVASGVGNGIEITSNNQQVMVNGCNISACSEHGIFGAGTILQIHNTRILDCGLSTGTYSGIRSTATLTLLTAIVAGNTGGGSTQNYGVSVGNGVNLTMGFCILFDNAGQFTATPVVTSAPRRSKDTWCRRLRCRRRAWRGKRALPGRAAA